MSDQDDQARFLLNRSSEAADSANERYLSWTRQMLSLAFAALTALVALQKNYIPGTAPARYLLWATFCSLAACVIMSAIMLRGEGLALRELSRDFARESMKPIETRKPSSEGRPPRICKLAGTLLPWMLSLSVLCLTAFAIANSM